jgi:hypothetical protein
MPCQTTLRDRPRHPRSDGAGALLGVYGRLIADWHPGLIVLSHSITSAVRRERGGRCEVPFNFIGIAVCLT